ncbi:MAG: small ribosomal subunit biogenesis GTPase RsgA [Leptolyngbyaceae cyanobacterium HOT.MB2.61]|jgi:ribosome biogenesis GTPase|nr:small ribosomal subunit biogenesis GTPase RsgA [Leptolyngbyaceae cyanobacterium HOT.MB2.61]
MSSELPEPPKDSDTNLLVGTVLAIQANYYRVQLDSVREPEARVDKQTQGWSGAKSSHPEIPSAPLSASSPPILLCTRRSRLKKIGQQVMVGDRVVIEEPDWAGGRGAIAQVFPRQSELDRPPVANANQILLVFALKEPDLDPYQLSRFLIKAESTELQVCLCLNKSDLTPQEEQEQWQKRLQQWGYVPVLISVRAMLGLNELKIRLRDRRTIVSGPSGVGKSSLINWLIPQTNLRVGAVSGKLARGRHTTRHVELFELPFGGLLADTPGFNQPELDCAPEALASYFPEARQRLAVANCHFSNCLHREEPNCVVRGDWERYDHYLVFLEEAIARRERLNQRGEEESSLKLKTRRHGQQFYEPKLEAKKYRRTSRRTQQQELKEFNTELEEAPLDDD